VLTQENKIKLQERSHLERQDKTIIIGLIGSGIGGGIGGYISSYKGNYIYAGIGAGLGYIVGSVLAKPIGKLLKPEQILNVKNLYVNTLLVMSWMMTIAGLLAFILSREFVCLVGTFFFAICGLILHCYKKLGGK
jgi:hypothetical protein